MVVSISLVTMTVSSLSDDFERRSQESLQKRGKIFPSGGFILAPFRNPIS
jgi:hypothetical protein